MFPQMSAIHMTGKTFFECLYLVLGLGKKNSLSQLSLCTHNSDHLLYNYFSIFMQFFPRMAPHFLVIIIHQVIWPSPGTLLPGKGQLNSKSSWLLVEISRSLDWRMDKTKACWRKHYQQSIYGDMYTYMRTCTPKAGLQWHHAFMKSCNTTYR